MECQSLDTSGLSLLAGFLDAVAISGELDLGVQVCFLDSGSLIFLESAGATPRLNELTKYNVSDMTCGWIDSPGTVVLMATSLPVAPFVSGSDGASVRLLNCEVVTAERVNFRAAPAGNRLDNVIPLNVRLIATARNGGWFFNVNYQGTSGWISADYVETEGICG